ncbi:calcium-activated chloride channel regulator 1-like [Haliotis rubra]|uniref:calcium-activated chloride channel regulator 1-like n=1 Tax=Haliotis rubra TaxID=36100 RepID=UPI001EE5B6C3|nr:calcium-activated chloride channel regulator 1-like [Haliotis rubra]
MFPCEEGHLTFHRTSRPQPPSNGTGGESDRCQNIVGYSLLDSAGDGRDRPAVWSVVEGGPTLERAPLLWVVMTTGMYTAMSLLAPLLLLLPLASGCGRGVIHIKDNEYRGMLIAIEESVPEDYSLIEKLQSIFTNASKYLYQVTHQRAYFGDVTILVPKSWSDRPQYEPQTKETVDKSDILIDQADDRFSYGNRPFVIKTTPCGELGHYMHLTPAYVLNDTAADLYGPYDKTIIHEWGHLRYGVFDEYPDEKSSQQFYAASRFYDVVRQTEGCRYQVGLPDSNCRFQPYTENTGEKYGSLMYSQQLQHIVHFCDNDPSSPLTLHNRQATNKQNQMCDGRSVWEVMREHGDFEKNFNPPRNVTSTVPTFRLVKESTRRTVLVLDTSGSMESFGRISKLARAASNYISRVLEDGEQLGIVWFNRYATIKSRLLVVNNVTRTELLQNVPRTASGATSIGDGILKGLEVLASTQGGNMILLSDGIETHPPYIRDVIQQIVDANVTVDTIAVSASADEQLEMLAQTTGGISFFQSDSDISNALNDAFIASSERGKCRFKCTWLAPAASNYISRVLEDGEQLGIVWFNRYATIKSRLLVVNNVTRTELLQNVPRTASGATSIGDGILKGLEVLASTQGGNMILLSDGIETHPPYIRDVIQQIVDANVTVDTIAVSASADEQLEMLAQTTGGISFFQSDSDISNALNDAFIASSERGKSARQRVLQLVSQSFLLQPGESYTDVIFFDSSIGVNTDISIGYNTTVPVVVMVTPGGHVLNSSSPEYTNEASFNTSNFHFKDYMETGGLAVNITNTHEEVQVMAFTVSSRVRQGQQAPILAHAQWGKSSVAFPLFQNLYISVSQGLSPLLKATVKATLEQPGLTSGEVTSVPLMVRDNGAGADATKNDGIYSAFVTNFTNNGRYYVTVTVNDNAATVVATDRVVGVGAAVGDVGGRMEHTHQNVGHFQRSTSAGSFSLTGFAPGSDLYPPCKISDLQVTVVGYKEVRLEWTAPGDDLDSGTAAGYELWMSTEFDPLYDNHTLTTPVTGDMVIEGDLANPAASGTAEYIVVKLDRDGDVTYYFTILATDDVEQRGQRSNIVSVSMKHVQRPDDVDVALIAGIVTAVCVSVVVVAVIVGVVMYRKKRRGFIVTIRKKYLG